MKLSLGIALFSAATFCEDAVPQAKSKQQAGNHQDRPNGHRLR